MPSENEKMPAGALTDARSLDDRESLDTLNEKRRATLAEIDNARFSWFHVRVCLVAGAGFFTDAYDIFAISIASVMLGYVYGHNQKLSANQDLGIKVATPVGTVVGQLLFGWLADVFGRKRIYGYELMLMITASFAQAVAGEAHAVNVIGVLVVWRFIMGVGIGGDYPLSSVIPAEFSSTRIRGRMLIAVGANQGWGQLTAALVAFVITAGYKDAVLGDEPRVLEHVDYMWRLLIGLGCVPGAVALYFRLTIPETPRFTMDVERNVRQAARDVSRVVDPSAYRGESDSDTLIERVRAPKASTRDFIRHFSKRENLVPLLGMCYSWFAIDVAFYGLGLNTSIILEAIGFGSPGAGVTGTAAVYETLRNISVGNMILAVAGLIPGAWTTFLVIDRWGRKPIQLLGFVMLTILYLIMGTSLCPPSVRTATMRRVASTHAENAHRLRVREAERILHGPQGFRLPLLLDELLLEFWPELDRIRLPGRIVPDALSLDRVRNRGCEWQARRGRLAGWVREARQHRRRERVRAALVGDLCVLHADGRIGDVGAQGRQAAYARRALERATRRLHPRISI